MRLTLWVFLLVMQYCQGWWTYNEDDHFLTSTQKELDTFHKMLHPLEDLGTSAAHNTKSATEQDEGGFSAASGERKTKNENLKDHHHESSKKGSSGKENKKTNYAHVIGMKSAHHDENEDTESHHHQRSGSHGDNFKDKLSHKKGNYEKGYRDKYHLDEFKHHDKFWSNKDTQDKYKKYGKHGVHHYSDHKAEHKSDAHKEGGEENHYGEKGEHSKTGHHKDHKGHKSATGKEQAYSHKSQKRIQHKS